MFAETHAEEAFETVIEARVLQSRYASVDRGCFRHERAISSELVLAAILRTTRGESRLQKLEALHGDKTGEQILGDLCKWMGQNGSLATLRHGFKCCAGPLRAAFVGTCTNGFDARGNLHAGPGGQL